MYNRIDYSFFIHLHYQKTTFKVKSSTWKDYLFCVCVIFFKFLGFVVEKK